MAIVYEGVSLLFIGKRLKSLKKPIWTRITPYTPSKTAGICPDFYYFIDKYEIIGILRINNKTSIEMEKIS